MCGVIGAVIHNPTNSDLELVKRVFLESSIRGLHATGLSIVQNNRIRTFIKPKPARSFVDDIMADMHKLLNEDGSLYLIGHCRYSTSDLDFNQPICNKTISIVHNGVITQELSENWQKLYGYPTITKNDSELLLHTIEANREPFEVWPNSSIAAIELHADKKMVYYRNGKRPIYQSAVSDRGIIITSTANIMERAAKGAFVSIMVPKDLKTSYINRSIAVEQVKTQTPDLQYV